MLDNDFARSVRHRLCDRTRVLLESSQMDTVSLWPAFVVRWVSSMTRGTAAVSMAVLLMSGLGSGVGVNPRDGPMAPGRPVKKVMYAMGRTAGQKDEVGNARQNGGTELLAGSATAHHSGNASLRGETVYCT